MSPVLTALLAGLVLASAWVVRLSTGLEPDSGVAARAVTGDEDATVSLVDAAGGVPLFDDVVLAPGDSVTRCLEVEAAAVGDPSPVVLHLDAPGADPLLAQHLFVDVSGGATVRGRAACTAGAADASRQETLAVLLEELAPGGEGWSVGDPEPGLSGWWYRFDVTFDEAAPQAALGAAIEDLSIRLSTDVVPPRLRLLEERTRLFVAGVQEDAAVPLVLLAVTTLLFLGIHRHIDALDPKLALAPVDRSMVPFPSRLGADVELDDGLHGPAPPLRT